MQPQDPTDGANAWGAPTLPPGAPLPPPPPNWGAHTQGEAPQYYYGVPTVAGRVLAAPGARIGASLIDGVLLIVVFFVMMFSTIGSFTQFQTASAGQWRNFQIFAAILPVSYGFMNAVVLTYAVGGSIGKKITGLRVIKTDGDRVDFGGNDPLAAEVCRRTSWAHWTLEFGFDNSNRGSDRQRRHCRDHSACDSRDQPGDVVLG